MKKVSSKVVERLLIYRRLLRLYMQTDGPNIYSHQLSRMTGFSSAQVRRDLMEIGYFGSSAHGYDAEELLKSIDEFVNISEDFSIALVGLGQLGRAILDYFQGHGPNLRIEVGFDINPQKIDRVIQGCRCFHVDRMDEVLKNTNILVGIIAVPATNAQDIADRFISNGINSLLNYTPTRLQLPPHVFVENIDLMNSIEKAIFFARRPR
ncbi:redox-sensing transcriptional repressor Rex [candidate division KSB1 bacterium]|nr:redox-sensing transcriptional repressor Rex [candidate division KSB1 bacterium]